jgi:hypothetical protein
VFTLKDVFIGVGLAFVIVAVGYGIEPMFDALFGGK